MPELEWAATVAIEEIPSFDGAHAVVHGLTVDESSLARWAVQRRRRRIGQRRETGGTVLHLRVLRFAL